MKKILKALMLIFVCLILTSCSCFGPTVRHARDPKWWGDTYGPEELIDGFRVCLRTDGYYQIIGTTSGVVKDGIYIIPQYINDIPVMGYGIPGYWTSSQLYNDLYYNGMNMTLETAGANSTQNTNIDKEPLYEGLENIKKVYINCHHTNGCPVYYGRNGGCYWVFDNAKTIMNYSVNNFYSDVDYDYFLLKGSENAILCFSYGDYFKVQALIEHFLLEHGPNDGNDFITYIITNVEFHYNLYIDGEEYHSFTHPENDLYWIDHLADGEKLMEPPIPYVEGQTFLGWYKDKECTIPFNFATEVVHEVEDQYVWLKLYAKWQ